MLLCTWVIIIRVNPPSHSKPSQCCRRAPLRLVFTIFGRVPPFLSLPSASLLYLPSFPPLIHGNGALSDTPAATLSRDGCCIVLSSGALSPSSTWTIARHRPCPAFLLSCNPCCHGKLGFPWYPVVVVSRLFCLVAGSPAPLCMIVDLICTALFFGHGDEPHSF